MAALDSESAGRIRNYRKLIAFRNVLIHGYAEVDDRLVWDMIEGHLPLLLADIQSISSWRSSAGGTRLSDFGYRRQPAGTSIHPEVENRCLAPN